MVHNYHGRVYEAGTLPCGDDRWKATGNAGQGSKRDEKLGERRFEEEAVKNEESEIQEYESCRAVWLTAQW